MSITDIFGRKSLQVLKKFRDPDPEISFPNQFFFKVSFFYKMKEKHYEKENSDENICNLGLA